MCDSRILLPYIILGLPKILGYFNTLQTKGPNYFTLTWACATKKDQAREVWYACVRSSHERQEKHIQTYRQEF